MVRPPLLLICPSDHTVDVGETRNFVARYWDVARRDDTTCDTLSGSSDVTRSAIWSSNNTGIATIGNDCDFLCRTLRIGGNKGLLTGIASGNTQITASHNGLVATADVIVSGSVVGSPITVKLTSDKTEVEEEGTINLEWTTTGDPERCEASEGWSGTKDVNGDNENVTVLFGGSLTKTFTLTCSKTGEDDVLSSITVTKLEPAAKNIVIREGTSCTSGQVITMLPLKVTESKSVTACTSDTPSTKLSNPEWSAASGCFTFTPDNQAITTITGTNACEKALTAEDLDGEYASRSINVNVSEPTVTGPKPAQPPVWKEVAP